jgi:uncharacterized protein (DUF1800 family)
MFAVMNRWICPSLLLSALLLAGCSVSVAPSTSAIVAPSAIAVAVTGAVRANIGTAVQYTATVTGTPNLAVTWSVNSKAGGNSTYGTISSSGLYTPPASVPTQNAITITATSQADTSASAATQVQILNAVPVISSVAGASSGAGMSLSVTGTNFLSTSIVQLAGQNLATTFVSGTQLSASIASAPAPGSQVAIIVINPSPGATQSSAYSLSIPGGPAASLAVTGSSQAGIGTNVQYAATITGIANTAVTWAVNASPGGSASIGTISATGLYSAPAAIPAQNEITISATSVADSSLTGSLQVTIVGDVPIVSSATATYNSDGSILIAVAGWNFVPSSAVQVNGSTLVTTYVSPTALTATLLSPPTVGIELPLLVVNAVPNPGQSAAYNLWIPASAAAATRLLDQTTFGANDSLIAHVQAVGLSGFLNEQLVAPASLLPDLPATLPSRCTASAGTCNKQNWWHNVLTGNDQLRQRVAFALGQIFVISYDDVSGYAFPAYVNTLANDAFGNWATIMNDVTLSPAMGVYLNMINSGKPAAGAIANENFARENMQLFNTGIDLLNQDGSLQLDAKGQPIPVYSELQVEAFSRAFTGWTYATSGGAIPGVFPNSIPNYDAPMVPVDSAHDTAPKALLTTTLPAGQTTQQDLDAALADVFNHPNVGPFVCKQLIQHLVASNPSPRYVARVAAVFANNGSGVRGDMPSVLKAIFMDQEARAGDAAPVTTDGHLREPILWLSGVVRGLAAVSAGPTDNSEYSSLDTPTTSQGEEVFRPPSVFNFFPPDYQVPGMAVLGPEFALETTASTMQKLNVASMIASNRLAYMQIDMTPTSPLGLLAVSSNNALLDELSKLFLHGQMSASMRTAILNTIAPVTDVGQRVRLAVYLVISSSQYKVVH